jgi:hypothetical protein
MSTGSDQYLLSLRIRFQESQINTDPCGPGSGTREIYTRHVFVVWRFFPDLLYVYRMLTRDVCDLQSLCRIQGWFGVKTKGVSHANVRIYILYIVYTLGHHGQVINNPAL